MELTMSLVFGMFLKIHPMANPNINYPENHRIFLRMNEDDMYASLTVTVPFAEAAFWKRILWSEFHHLASGYFNLKTTRTRTLFNDLICDMVADLVTGDLIIGLDDLKSVFLQRSRKMIAEAAVDGYTTRKVTG